MKNIIEQTKKISIPTISQEQRKRKLADIAFSLVKKEIVKYSEILDIEYGGSFAKGTWLPDKADIDIFIKFKKDTPEKNFTDISKKIGFDSLKKYNPYLRYSEHPYVEAVLSNDTKVNVVPCYDVNVGEWKSAADRSSFHTKFMKEKLTDSMKNEVRILKKFLKNNNIYGAEIAKQGFSGYVSEVLIWNFKTFSNVVKSFSEIKENFVIGQAEKQFDTSVVIMDPIDKKRNLAAAISNENIGKFILLCRHFKNSPSKRFFMKRKNPRFSANLDNVVIVSFNFRLRSPDIIWGQAKRTASSISNQLKLGGFNVLRNSVFTDEKKRVFLMFLLESRDIHQDLVKEGPDFFNRSDSEKFISKNLKKSKLIWIDSDKKIHSIEKRKFHSSNKFLVNLIRNDIEKSGIPKGLKEDISKGFKVFYYSSKLEKSIKEELFNLTSTDETIFYSNK